MPFISVPFMEIQARQTVTNSIEKVNIIFTSNTDIVKIVDKSTAAIVAWNWKRQ